MKTGWAMAIAAAVALFGAGAASAAEPMATAPALPTVELSERAVCEEAPVAAEEVNLFASDDPKCEDYGFFAADKKKECEQACKKNRKCVKKERCGDTGCPEPGYCWKCG